MKISKYLILILFLFFLLVSFNSVNAQDVNNTSISDSDYISVKTYTDLYYEINSTEDGSILNLTESYKFDSKIDNDSFIDGVKISKNLTLVGKNNNYIDGNFLASGLNISSNCCVVLKNILFKNGYSETSSGAILVGKNSNVFIDNCTFFNNKVHNSNGGAIYGLESTNIEVNNSKFYNNIAERQTTLSWDAFKCGMGGAICMRIGSNLKLNNSSFKNHVSYVTTILIITWDDVNTNQSTLYVDNCLFENNVAYSNCAIYLDEFGIAEIKNSVFRKNNSTDLGGTIVFDASKNALVKNCSFEDNCGVNGGGIYINTFDPKYDSHVEIYDSKFMGNHAIKNGGGLYSIHSTTKVVNCEFIENNANSNGGGIYAWIDSIHISGSKFLSNVAQNGGGSFLKTSENIVSNSLYSDNVAFNNGGAVYCNYGLIKISDSFFEGNSGQYGGCLFLRADENIVSKSSFSKNTASKKGGAIYSKMLHVSSSKCIFSKNYAPKASEVYGVYYVKVTKYILLSGDIKLKIILSSPWGILSNQKIKVKLNKYSSKWIKSNKKGIFTLIVPKNKKVNKKTLNIVMDNGFCIIKKYVFKNPGKIKIPKKIKKSSKLKIIIKNSQNNKFITKTKFTVKVYTGKHYKKFLIKTNSKGSFKIKMNQFKKGNHKISFYLNNDEYYINKKLILRIK